ncbi:hypothetical protein [Adhaeribacter soli]|uniref:Uncharacterized protein n=1 Tax=Adhaeribacter soli TaxID=2607655 RepID=A0A5N1JAA1_9BACT|nr:hypothetical protein [Adhaeribacter soli]KAA9345938.1 hypothetical protein F0P94_02315 [Adhaeribacter soli]
MQTELQDNIKKVDVLAFLLEIKEKVHSVDELLDALQAENRRIEDYGQFNIDRLLEISTYQWQLEQVEMKLKAPSLIKITFAQEGEKTIQPKTEEEKIEALLIGLIMKFLRESDNAGDQGNGGFNLINP